MTKFQKLLIEARKKAGVSTRELERLSGVSKSYISMLEGGQRGVPAPEILQKLAGPLNVSYDELMAAAGYIDIPDEPRYKELKAVSLTDEYIEKGLTEEDIRRILDGVVKAIKKAKGE